MLCNLYDISEFAVCIFACTKDYFVEILCFPEKTQIVFYY